jgi:UDPglucose--hexose-1-phosphate uridylyltransferase
MASRKSGSPQCFTGADPLGRHFTIISPSRAERPGALASGVLTGDDFSRPDPHEKCPFCPGNENETPPSTAFQSDKTGAWIGRIVPNRFPAVYAKGVSDPNAIFGVHEVVIETPGHNPGWAYPEAPDTAALWEMILLRIREHRENRDLKTLVWFKNQGASAGASLEHPHSQILGTSLESPAQKRTNRLAAADWRREGSSWLARLVAREKKARKRMVFSREGFSVFCPESIRSPYGLWLVPDTYEDPLCPTLGEAIPFSRVLGETLRRFQVVHGVDAPFNLVLHLRMPGKYPGFGWYLEVLPRLSQFAGWEWATETFIHPVKPSDAAKAYREAKG